MQLDEVSRQAMQLSLEERAELAQQLLLSLDEAGDAEIEQLWVEESARRLDRYRSGQTESLAADEVFRRASQDISR